MTLSRSTCDVTVVIPAFNSIKTLERAIASVLTQTVLPQEIFIIDDCSSDDTYTLALQLANDNREIEIKVLKNARNLGPGLTRNAGWNSASSKYIAFLDADDSWDSRKLEIQIGWMENHPECDLSCTQTRYYQETEDFSYSKFQTSTLTLRAILFRNPIPTRTVVLRNEIAERYPKDLNEDFALWTELLRNGRRLTKLEIPLAIHYRPDFAPGGLSSALIPHEYFEVQNIARNFKLEPLIVPVALIFSIIKFMRRLIINFLRRAMP